ncbi:hypothetical protein ACFZB9_25515 [Kitasatospora sp. NPDC008050]|uniref:hypothetical protein n=1 Tax=Kitasatospora sp. NPDC008050 TaxID=3364021 RepID=UPI0036F0429C
MWKEFCLMVNDSPENLPVDPTSSVDLQQLTAAAAQTAGISPELASSVQGTVRQERAGAISTVTEPTTAEQTSTGPAFRRKPTGSGR